MRSLRKSSPAGATPCTPSKLCAHSLLKSSAPSIAARLTIELLRWAGESRPEVISAPIALLLMDAVIRVVPKQQRAEPGRRAPVASGWKLSADRLVKTLKEPARDALVQALGIDFAKHTEKLQKIVGSVLAWNDDCDELTRCLWYAFKWLFTCSPETARKLFALL